MNRLKVLHKTMARVFAVSVTVVVIFLALCGLSLKFFFGMRFERRSKSSRIEGTRTGRRPVATMRIIGLDGQNRNTDGMVSITAFNDVYASVGVTGTDFANWQKLYGVDSLGVSPDGVFFVAGFPVLSKIAWMYVDSVTLTPEETTALIDECERVEPRAVSVLARQELNDIIGLAREALKRHGTVSFG